MNNLMEEENPVKVFLFDYLSKSNQIQKLRKELKFTEILENILENCYEKATLIGNKEENAAVLVTGSLHYILTNALIKSQRKIEYSGILIDVAIPDLKTIIRDPSNGLLIYISKTNDEKLIKGQLKKLQKIQKEKRNIWAVLPEERDVGHQTYIIGDKKSLIKIFNDISNFVKNHKQSKINILNIE